MRPRECKGNVLTVDVVAALDVEAVDAGVGRSMISISSIYHYIITQ